MYSSIHIFPDILSDRMSPDAKGLIRIGEVNRGGDRLLTLKAKLASSIGVF